jgi:hypothetical protein
VCVTIFIVHECVLLVGESVSCIMVGLGIARVVTRSRVGDSMNKSLVGRPKRKGVELQVRVGSRVGGRVGEALESSLRARFVELVKLGIQTRIQLGRSLRRVRKVSSDRVEAEFFNCETP